MAGKYFNLFDDVYIPGRWELNDPLDQQGHEVGTWRFRRGELVHVEGPLRIPLYVPGHALDLSMLAGATIPVVHARVAEIFAP